MMSTRLLLLLLCMIVMQVTFPVDDTYVACHCFCYCRTPCYRCCWRTLVAGSAVVEAGRGDGHKMWQWVGVRDSWAWRWIMEILSGGRRSPVRQIQLYHPWIIALVGICLQNSSHLMQNGILLPCAKENFTQTGMYWWSVKSRTSAAIGAANLTGIPNIPETVLFAR